jgi:hypothetical protein
MNQLGEEPRTGFPANPTQWRDEYRPLSMELGLRLLFLVAILKDDLWRISDTESLSGHIWGEVGMCACFLTEILCLQLCCDVQIVQSGGGLCALERLLCNLSFTFSNYMSWSMRPWGRGYSGLV